MKKVPLVAIILALLAVWLQPAVPVLADTTAWCDPSANEGNSNWTSPENSYSSDNNHMTTVTAGPDGATVKLYNFNLGGIQGTINGIEVDIEAKKTGSGDGRVRARLMWNGRSSETSYKETGLVKKEQYHTLGGGTDTWGRTWRDYDFANADFAVRITSNIEGGTLSVDHVRVRVYYSNSDPTVDTVALYESNQTVTATAINPQTEYAVKVTVTDADTLADLSRVEVTIFYDADGVYAPVDIPGTGNVQTAAILTLTVAATPTWEIDAVAGGGSWTIETANCTQPTLTSSTGDFWFAFKPGKVATETTGSSKWHIYAKADDGGTPGDNYQANRTMNWYGEITVNTASIDFGLLAPGTDFGESSKQGSVSVTYIANGAYDEKVAASSPWTDGGTNSADLDVDGSPAASSFSLKANDVDDLGTAVFVATTAAYAATDDSGTQTGESGDTVATNTLWLALGTPLVDTTYNGTIYYQVADGS